MIITKILNHSLWVDTVDIDRFPSLNEDKTCDVLVIGGGLAGILVAYKAQCAGLKVILIEKNRIGRGITSNTTAVISLEHDTLYHELMEKIGKKKTIEYFKANVEALKEYQELSKRFDFDYEEKDNCIYSTSDEAIMKKEYETLKELGADVSFIAQVEIPINVKGAVIIKHQAQMNPLKLIKELSKQLTIYEDTPALKISTHGVKTDKCFIKAKKIVIATHFPFIDRHGLYYTKMYQNRSYVVAIKDEYPLKYTYTNYDDKDFYFRNYKNYLLIGGNDHRVGVKGDCFSSLKQFVEDHYLNRPLVYAWHNQDCISIDNVPYLGSYSLLWRNIYVMTGFNMWGMSQSMIGAKVLVDLFLNNKSEYSSLYNPSRFFIKKQLFLNLGNYLKYLLSFKTPRCSHMGCALVYNKKEKTWECPAHGSCFNEEHHVLHNPATKPFK